MLTDAFQPDKEGYIRDWVHSRTKRTPYVGSEADESAQRAQVIRDVGPALAMASLGGPAPEGQTWRYSYAPRNTFLDQGAFHHKLGHVSLYASTLLVSNRSTEIAARLWTANTVDLWQDQTHRIRYTRDKRKKVSVSPAVTIVLNPAQNRITVQLQELAVRDTPFQFALQLMEIPEGLKVAIPGHPAATSALRKASDWLDSLTVDSNQIRAPYETPNPVEVTLDRPQQSTHRNWITGETAVSWHEDDVFSCRVEAQAEGQKLFRLFEIPGNLQITNPGEDLDDFRSSYLERIAQSASGEQTRSLFASLARHAIGTSDREADEAALEDAIDHVSGRLDCADFRLAALLRLYALDWGHPEQRNMIRMTALGFRYWKDEPGQDAMAFGSENHAILFHGCQYLAGSMFPDDPFTNSERTGSEQRELGKARCQEWLNEKHAQGFTEYLSASYTSIIAAALLNLADFADDAEIKTSASTLLDRLFKQLAEHTFDGVTNGPQGRVYRTVLYPNTAASQGLLSYAAGEHVAESIDSWSAFLGTSSAYQPPKDLENLVGNPIKRTYHHANHCLQLNKTANFVVSSVQVDTETRRQAGNPGCQEALWHASLSRACHVFVTHPGCTADGGFGHPGYWYGNGILPTVSQQDATVLVTYDIPKHHPVGFTHAHWPSDAFEETNVDEESGWYVGRLGDGWDYGVANQQNSCLTSSSDVIALPSAGRSRGSAIVPTPIPIRTWMHSTSIACRPPLNTARTRDFPSMGDASSDTVGVQP